jgi:hypothetical protein
MPGEPIAYSPTRFDQIKLEIRASMKSLISNSQKRTSVLGTIEKRFDLGWRNDISFLPNRDPFMASSSRLELSNGPSTSSIKISKFHFA